MAAMISPILLDGVFFHMSLGISALGAINNAYKQDRTAKMIEKAEWLRSDLCDDEAAIKLYSFLGKVKSNDIEMLLDLADKNRKRPNNPN